MFFPSPFFFRVCMAAVLCAVVLAGIRPAHAQLSTVVPAVDTSDRAAVIELYHDWYMASVGIDSGWTGSILTGDPGTVSDAFLQGTLRRINYFRSMSGLNADLTFDAASNAKCQQAAVMMSAEQNISHTPPSDWKWYTADADAACAASDIRLDWQGDEGALAIDKFIADDESNNTYVGHRRWLLFAGEKVMATGAVPGDGQTFPGTNATWVTNVVARPADAPAATSWPPSGFVPAPLVFRRWSFSYLNADFSSATVKVSKNGVAQYVTQELVEYQSTADGGGQIEGDNTLVWEMPENTVSTVADESYDVTVSNVLIDGSPQRLKYTVTTINPDTPTVSLTTLKPYAYKNGKRGRFLISRTGDTSAPLTVGYSVGGTAQPATAYNVLTGTVTIPAGASFAKVKVVPVDSAPADTDGQTVTATLLDGGSAYAPTTAATGTVTIQP